MKKAEHQKDLFKKIIENASFQKEIDALRMPLKDSIWWVTKEGKEMRRFASGRSLCPIAVKKGSKHACRKRLHKLLKEAKRTKRYKRFECSGQKFGICLPILQGDRIYGYVVICNSKNKVSDNTISFFTNFVDTLVREMQKELELVELYRTIRPRAIALSTIHTIRRIISSTLNLDELLPRLARLCLQIFQVEKSCILLKNLPKKPVLITAVRGSKDIAKNDRGCINKLMKQKILAGGKILMKRNLLCVPLTEEDVIGAICVMDKADKAPLDEFDKEILVTLSEQAAVALKNAQLYKEQEDIALGSIKSLAALLDTRTPGTYRVRESFIKLVLAMGKELHLNAEDLRNLHYASILHDAGQVAFPDELLKKKDRLTGKEYKIIKRHPSKGASIIKHLGFLKPVVPVILHHHENYDGNGYPMGLRGKEIPLGARVMAVASTFSTMITKRPHRKEVGVKRAIAEIKKNSGSQFDPVVVKAFLAAVKNKEIIDLLDKEL